MRKTRKRRPSLPRVRIESLEARRLLSGPSAFGHITDGQFDTINGHQEWSDITPAAFADSRSYLYGDQANLNQPSGSPPDTFMLMYDETAVTKPLGPDQFVTVSFTTVEHEDGHDRLNFYVDHLYADGTITFIENGVVQTDANGNSRVHEIGGQSGIVGFGPSPNSATPHAIAEFQIALSARQNVINGGYSPDPQFWTSDPPEEPPQSPPPPPPPPPTAPVAHDDTARLFLGQPSLPIPVLANDTGDNIDPSSVLIVSSPDFGTVQADANGVVTYTPNASFTGSDIFSYVVSNTDGEESNVASVEVDFVQPAGQVIPVTLPQVQVPVLPVVGELKHFQVTYESLNLQFTSQTPGGPAFADLQSNVGSLPVDVTLFIPNPIPLLPDIPIPIPFPVATSTAVAHLTFFKAKDVQVPPPANFSSFSLDTVNNALLNAPPGPLDQVVRWSTPGFDIKDTITGLIHHNTGPLTFWVNLAPLISATASLAAKVQTVEAFIHTTLIAHLPQIDRLAIIQDPPANVLITAPNGLQTGFQSTGQVVQNIPGSFYFSSPNDNAIVILNPDDGNYQVQVLGNPNDSFSLSESLLDINGNFSSPFVIQDHQSGTLGAAGVNTYSFQMAHPPADPRVAPHNVLFGTDANFGRLLRIDPLTGAGTVVGPMNIGSVPALAIDPTSGFMYAGTGGGSPVIYKINPTNGVATLVGNTFLGFAAVGDLAFRADGTLFASVNITGDGGTGSDHLAILNKTTGRATVIGPYTTTNSPLVQGMEAIAFDASGNLWGAVSNRAFGSVPGLYRIDPATGRATFIAPFLNSAGAPPTGGVVSLQFINGILYGGTGRSSIISDSGRLISIDPATGRFAFVDGVSATSGSSLGALALFASPPGHATSAFLQAGLDGTTTVIPSSQTIGQEPTLTDQLERIVLFRLDAGLISDPVAFLEDLVDGLVEDQIIAPEQAGDIMSNIVPQLPVDPPIHLTLRPPTGAVEGIALTNVIVATVRDEDPTAHASDYTATITWGDGGSSTATAANGGIVANADGSFSIIGSHTYGEEAAALNFSVEVQDAGGAHDRADTTIAVTDPAVVAVGVPVAGAETTALASVVVATFTDPGGAEPNAADPAGTVTDHYSASIDWGDGLTSPGVIVLGGGGVFNVIGTHAYGDNGVYPVVTAIHHESATPAIARASASIFDVAPVATLRGLSAPSTAWPGMLMNYTLSAIDPASPDNAVGFKYNIDWGDGTAKTVLASPWNGLLPGLQVSHVFTAEGTFVITLTATDKDGLTSAPVSKTVTLAGSIAGAAASDDPQDPTKTALFIFGTSANDNLTVALSSGGIVATVNGTKYGSPTGFAGIDGRIYFFGRDGNDTLVSPKGLANAVVMLGGAGGDKLTAAGSGSAVLVGGDGDDTLQADGARSLLIGGNGKDKLLGSGSDDILIGGRTVYDTNLPGLSKLMVEWTSGNTYADRVAHLTGTVGGFNGSTFIRSGIEVFDDAAIDSLTGGAGSDLWFALLSGTYKDALADFSATEIKIAL